MSFTVDNNLQPIAKTQTSHLKDTTEIVKFIDSTKVPENAILVSMDVTKACTLTDTVCKAYETFYKKHTSIPNHSLRELLTTYTSGKLLPK